MAKPTEPQSAANHARFVPGFHGVAGMFALVYVLWSAYRVFTQPGTDSAMTLVGAVALLLIGWYARQFAVAVQDRVIRLEEQLRLARLLPADLRARTDEFTPSQLIAMRFASDAELPSLAQRVLAEKIGDRAAIKAMIKDWRADNLRA